jgi:integrase
MWTSTWWEVGNDHHPDDDDPINIEVDALQQPHHSEGTVMASNTYVGPAYQLASGKSWSFRFGPQKLSGGKFPNETKCNAARRAKIAEFELGTAQAQPNKNFGVILDELLAWERERLKGDAVTDATKKGNLKWIKLIRADFGRLKLKDVTHARMQKFQQALIDADRLSESVSCRTTWRHAFDLCCREGYCTINLARVGEPLKARRPEPRTQICTDEQYARLTAVTAKGWPYLPESQRLNLDAAIKLARFHRCRHQDICGLRPIDVEWDNPPLGWVWFQRAWCPVKNGIKMTKGSASGKGHRRKKEERRYQPIVAQEVRDALWLVWQQVKADWECAGCPDDWAMFRGTIGTNYYKSLGVHFRKAMKLAKLEANGEPLFHLHDIRRIDANQAEQLGISPADFARVLGNSEDVAKRSYMNAGQDVLTDAKRAQLFAMMLALAPRPSTPLLLTSVDAPCHEMDTTDQESGGK